jgi:Cu-Zn family superoxide dismutase
MRTPLTVLGGLVAALALAGCSSSGAGSDAAPQSSAPAEQQNTVQTSATFAAGGGTATTYDEALVPAGANASVSATAGDGGTTVTLEVGGLQPDRAYGAHAHAKPCGPTGADAGPHFQHEQDPVTPSVDPAYANPENEIWLDFTTDAQGAATTTSTVDWAFPQDRRAGSVIIHEMPTKTAAGEAGVAGDRVACIAVDF